MRRADLEFIKLCNEIDYLQEQLKEAQADAEHWRKLYNEQLNNGIRHGEEMMGSLLNVLLTPGVTDAFRGKRREPLPAPADQKWR